jgi:hypothetical protein
VKSQSWRRDARAAVSFWSRSLPKEPRLLCILLRNGNIVRRRTQEAKAENLDLFKEIEGRCKETARGKTKAES